MDFFRYPHIPHIKWLAEGRPREDKVMSPAEVARLLAGPVVVEEKLDGANLGFSIGPDGVLRPQNRGQYLFPPFAGQFARLGEWLAMHEDSLFDALSETLVVFGEWCAARHSLNYDRLPDWWLMFDVYDREEKRFWSTARRNMMAASLAATEVPCVRQGRVRLEQLQEWVACQPSRFGGGPIEGVVVRCEDSRWLQECAKLVRPDFTQAIAEHWRDRPLSWNRMRVTAHE